MRHARLSLTAIVLLGLSACGGPSDSDKAKVVSVAVGWPVKSGTLGACLSQAGYDVSPDLVKSSVMPQPDKGWYRVAFVSNSHDTVHLAVDLPDGRVVPYKAGDDTALTGLGCGILGDPYA